MIHPASHGPTGLCRPTEHHSHARATVSPWRAPLEHRTVRLLDRARSPTRQSFQATTWTLLYRVAVL